MKKVGGGGPAAPAKPALPTAEALYDYAAAAPDELSFSAGEVLFVRQEDASGWWEAQRASGEIGWAPATYLRKN